MPSCNKSNFWFFGSNFCFQLLCFPLPLPLSRTSSTVCYQSSFEGDGLVTVLTIWDSAPELSSILFVSVGRDRNIPKCKKKCIAVLGQIKGFHGPCFKISFWQVLKEKCQVLLSWLCPIYQ